METPAANDVAFVLERRLGFWWTEEEESPTRRFAGVGFSRQPSALPLEGVREAARELLERPSGHGGLQDLAAFAAALSSWPTLADFRTCAGAGADAIEGKGADGLARTRFASGLNALARQLGHAALEAESQEWFEISWQWGEVATAMRLAVRDGAWDGLPEFVAALHEREREAATRLLKLSDAR